MPPHVPHIGCFPARGRSRLRCPSCFHRRRTQDDARLVLKASLRCTRPSRRTLRRARTTRPNYPPLTRAAGCGANGSIMNHATAQMNPKLAHQAAFHQHSIGAPLSNPLLKRWPGFSCENGCEGFQKASLLTRTLCGWDTSSAGRVRAGGGGGGERRQLLRGSEAAAVPCALPGDQAAYPSAGRGHELRRLQDRPADSGRCAVLRNWG